MQTLPITPNNWPDAVKLLCEGFPERDEAFWEKGLERWINLVGNSFAQPVGYLTQDKDGELQSVLLTFRTPAYHGATPRTNFSSWYVKDDVRSRAPLMLKKLSHDANTTYTDFTPSASVERILRRLNYSEYQAIHLGFWTPLTALGKSQIVVDAGTTLEFVGQDSYLGRAIDDHLKLGCTLLGLRTEDGIEPVLMRLKKRKRLVTSAEIIYCADIRAIEAHLPALCRHLMKRGILILECELPHLPRRFQPAFNWGEVSRFIKGSWNKFQLDGLYSEIPILGV